MNVSFQFVVIYVLCSLFWLQVLTALMTIVSTGRLPYPLGWDNWHQAQPSHNSILTRKARHQNPKCTNADRIVMCACARSTYDPQSFVSSGCQRRF